MQSRLFAKKVTTMTAQGSILEAFGVTLEHFGHQMAPQRHFWRGGNFDAKTGLQRSKTELRERAEMEGGGL